MAEFAYQDLLPLGEDVTPYRLLTRDGVSPLAAGGRTFLEVATAALTLLGWEAMRDIAHLFRPGHLEQLAVILRDPEASANDRFVALELLKNACVAAGGVDCPPAAYNSRARAPGDRDRGDLSRADEERSCSILC